MQGTAVVTTSVWQRNVARRQYIEDDLQKSVVQFLALALPPEATFFAIPNGGLRTKREAARLRAMGVRAGVPDLLVIYRGRPVFLELKRAGIGRVVRAGRTSDRQKLMMQELIYAGAEVCTARTLVEAEAALREAGVHLKASAA